MSDLEKKVAECIAGIKNLEDHIEAISAVLGAQTSDLKIFSEIQVMAEKVRDNRDFTFQLRDYIKDLNFKMNLTFCCEDCHLSRSLGEALPERINTSECVFWKDREVESFYGDLKIFRDENGKYFHTKSPISKESVCRATECGQAFKSTALWQFSVQPFFDKLDSNEAV